MATEADLFLAEARKFNGMRGRPNAATEWYAARHGSAFLEAAWCAMFLSWVSGRLGLLAKTGEFAYCPWWASDFKKRGLWGMAPRRGAIVFFDWDDDGVADHVGVVENLATGGWFYSREGNTSDTVALRKRHISDVYGFGYPAWAQVKPVWPGSVIQVGSKGKTVKALQERLIKLGFKLPKYGADGIFGAETKAAVIAFQKKAKLTATGVVSKEVWLKLWAA